MVMMKSNIITLLSLLQLQSSSSVFVLLLFILGSPSCSTFSTTTRGTAPSRTAMTTTAPNGFRASSAVTDFSFTSRYKYCSCSCSCSYSYSYSYSYDYPHQHHYGWNNRSKRRYCCCSSSSLQLNSQLNLHLYLDQSSSRKGRGGHSIGIGSTITRTSASTSASTSTSSNGKNGNNNDNRLRNQNQNQNEKWQNLLFGSKRQDAHDNSDIYHDEDHDDNTHIQKAHTNLLIDLTAMRKSRTSKLKSTSTCNNNKNDDENKNKMTEKDKKQQKQTLKQEKQEQQQRLYDAISQNHELRTLYSSQDHYYHIKNITSIVGPMHRRNIEAMICKHPKLMADILLHQYQHQYQYPSGPGNNSRDNKATSNTNNNNNESYNLRSVFDQLLMDLNLSPSSTSISSTSQKKIEQLEQKLLPPSSVSSTLPSSTRTTILSKMNRKNIRTIIFQIFKSSLQMSNEDLYKVIIKAPQLLLYSSYNIQQSVSYLQNELQLTTEDVRRMILIRPMVLAHDFHSTEDGDDYNYGEGNKTKGRDKAIGDVEAKGRRKKNKADQIIDFLSNDLKIDYKKVIVRYPQLFELKAGGLMEKAQFLLETMKLHRWNDLSFTVSAFPPLLWLSETNIEQKVHFLSTELELDDHEIRDVLVTYPQIMGLSVEQNLRHKVDYFIREGGTAEEGAGAGLSRQELKELFLYQPALLAYSLENRIKPRLRSLEENYISFCYAPPYLMSLSESKFDQWLEMQKSTWSIR